MSQNLPFTFVPAVILPTTNFVSKQTEMPKTVLEVWIIVQLQMIIFRCKSQLCNQAGWETNVSSEKNSEMFSFSPYPFDLPKVFKFSTHSFPF
jgi:hypothetical protein